MFERYTEGARRTLFFARYEASQLGGSTIEAEHLLLGLMRDGPGAISDIFNRAGLSYTDARRKIEAHVGVRHKIATSVEIPFSGAMHRVLRYAMEQADALKDREISREHLLLGILKEETSVAARMLLSRGITLQTVIERLSGDHTDPIRRDPPGASDPALNAIATVEQIRALVVELERHRFNGAVTRASTYQIHMLLDALKRHIGGV